MIPALMLLLALTGFGTGKSSVVGGNVANCIFLVGSGDSGINEGVRVVSIDGAKSPLDHFGEEGSGVVVFLSVGCSLPTGEMAKKLRADSWRR